MLIPSARHTPADLALWQEYEEADRLVSIPGDLIQQTIDAMRSWSGDHVCTSWGKDSVVMLHLCVLSGLRLPVVYVRLRGFRDNPDCEVVRDVFLRRFDIAYHERTFVYEDCQHGEHWAAIADEFGPHRMTGIRGDESAVRRMSIGRFGLDTGRSFRPLGQWRQPWIFAHLARHELPVHPAYACLGGGRWPREHLRTHSIGGIRGTGAGRREWEAEYYGAELRRLKASIAQTLRSSDQHG